MSTWSFKALLFTAALCVFFGASSPGTVAAQGIKSVRDQIEHSLLLKGTIDVDADGSVAAFALDKAEALSESLSDFVRDAVMAWRFEPVLDASGVAIAARAPLSLRLVARQRDDDRMNVYISSAHFTEYNPDDLTSVAFKEVKPPSFPTNAARANVSGDVYVNLKIGRDGRVQDVSTMQVNLSVVSDERGMTRWRRVLANASERAVKQWTFRVPTEGEVANAPYWVVQVPISYRIGDDAARAGKGEALVWQAYVPGPIEPTPWASPDDVRTAMSPDALADGGVYLAREDGLRLLTPLKSP